MNMDIKTLDPKAIADIDEAVSFPEYDLTQAEDVARKRRDGLAYLLEGGLITPETQARYSQPFQELPTDREELKLAYYLQIWTLDYPVDIQRAERINSLCDEYDIAKNFKALKARGKRTEDMTLYELLGDKDGKRTKRQIIRIQAEGGLHLAELFVDTKRKRIKTKALPLVSLCLAATLAIHNADDSLNDIPHLRKWAAEGGYKDNMDAPLEALRESSFEGLEGAAAKALDVIELAYLNGILEARLQEVESVRSEEDRFREPFPYRDIYDEVIFNLADIAAFVKDLNNAIVLRETPREWLGMFDKTIKYCNERARKCWENE